MELMTNGTVDDFIHKNKSKDKASLFLRIAKDTARGYYCLFLSFLFAKLCYLLYNRNELFASYETAPDSQRLEGKLLMRYAKVILRI